MSERDWLETLKPEGRRQLEEYQGGTVFDPAEAEMIRWVTARVPYSGGVYPQEITCAGDLLRWLRSMGERLTRESERYAAMEGELTHRRIEDIHIGGFLARVLPKGDG